MSHRLLRAFFLLKIGWAGGMVPQTMFPAASGDGFCRRKGYGRTCGVQGFPVRRCGSLRGVGVPSILRPHVRLNKLRSIFLGKAFIRARRWRYL